VGGEGNSAAQSGVFPDIEAYDPETDSWERFPPMAVPRHGFAAAALGGRIYLPGGATEQGFGAADDHSMLAFE
ncbi:MAG TPA: kelch repeat-containing protein, partial [Polyangiaceae bacterium]